jgi:hypothetical protein
MRITSISNQHYILALAKSRPHRPITRHYNFIDILLALIIFIQHNFPAGVGWIDLHVNFILGRAIYDVGQVTIAVDEEGYE